MKILILEDEADFREGLVELFTLEGFEVQGIGSINEFKMWQQKNQCDVLILDRNLPDGDGLLAIKEYQHKNPITSIILSCEGQAHDRIDGINADADYYLVKPFPLDELIAIIHRVERKIQPAINHSSTWYLNQVRWEIKAPNNLEIELTRSEYILMSCFVNRSGQTISRNEIIRGLGYDPIDYDNRRLEVMLRRLRKKVEDSGVVKFPLQTVYGVGLAFTELLRES